MAVPDGELEQDSSLPLQSWSMLSSHISTSPGLRYSSVSSQSVLSKVYPAGCAQPLVVALTFPKPSPSASANQTVASVASASSIWPSQLLSIPSQISSAPGLVSASRTSQSSSARKPSPSASTIILCSSVSTTFSCYRQANTPKIKNKRILHSLTIHVYRWL